MHFCFDSSENNMICMGDVSLSGHWDSMEEYMCYIPHPTYDGMFYRAVFALHFENYQQAQQVNKKCRPRDLAHCCIWKLTHIEIYFLLSQGLFNMYFTLLEYFFFVLYQMTWPCGDHPLAASIPAVQTGSGQTTTEWEELNSVQALLIPTLNPVDITASFLLPPRSGF